ncbi:MAG: DUF3450 family protein [Pseudomonadota bacterium]
MSQPKLAQQPVLRYLAVLAVLCIGVPLAAMGESDQEAATALVGRWLSVEQQRSALRDRWEERQARGRAQLALLDKERATLTEYLERSTTDQAESDARRTELLREQSALESEADRLADALPVLVDRLETLYPRLPPPLAVQWDDVMPTLRSAESSDSERLAAVVRALRQEQDWQARIPVHRTLMRLGEQDVQVDQIYLGTAHGWYVSLDGRLAGYGFSTADAWTWGSPEPSTSDLGQRLRRWVDRSKAPDGRLLSVPVSMAAFSAAVRGAP